MKRRHLGMICLSVLIVLACVAPATAQNKNKKTGTSAQTTQKIDLNSATKDQLKTLPGVGNATAQKIIDNRPYRAKNQLISKKIVSQDVYNKFSDQVIAKQSPASAKKKGQ